MKKQLFQIVATLSLCLMLGAIAMAQTTRQMTVTVPFTFYVGTTALPAGTYTVYSTGSHTGDGFLLRDANGQHKVVFNAQQSYSAEARQENKLEFRRYDNKYFLAGVWTVGNNIGYELQPIRGNVVALTGK